MPQAPIGRFLERMAKRPEAFQLPSGRLRIEKTLVQQQPTGRQSIDRERFGNTRSITRQKAGTKALHGDREKITHALPTRQNQDWPYNPPTRIDQPWNSAG